MSDSRLIGSALVAVGVVIIVIGAGLVIGGYNQQRLAEAWADQKEAACFEAITIPSDASPEEISRIYNEKCGGPYRNNPYAGGELEILTGLVVALTGGAVAYYGAR